MHRFSAFLKILYPSPPNDFSRSTAPPAPAIPVPRLGRSGGVCAADIAAVQRRAVRSHQGHRRQEHGSGATVSALAAVWIRTTAARKPGAVEPAHLWRRAVLRRVSIRAALSA